jgi:hypothetical protein
MGSEYRIEAVTEKEPRRSYLLKQAAQREDYADFYEASADMDEEYQSRHVKRQEAA